MRTERNMKVLIVDALGASSGVRHSSTDAIGCGPRRIAGVLESNRLDVKIVLAEYAINQPSLMDDYDLLMVSAMTIDLQAVQKIINCWRIKHRSQPAIIGGPIAGRPKLLFNLGFDIAVVGEGEISIQRLLDDRLGESKLAGHRKTVMLDGVGYQSGDKEFTRWTRDSTGYRHQIQRSEALDTFSPSTRCIRDYPAFRALKFYVEIARGCSNFLRTSIPLPDGSPCIECDKCRGRDLEARTECPANIPPGCGFCSVPTVFGCSRSRKEIEIVKEVRELVRSGVRRITLSASDFLDYGRDEMVAPQPLSDPNHPGPNIGKIESLLSKLTSIPPMIGVPKTDYVYFSAENIKPSLFDDEVASVIAEHLPNSTIHLGCETGSEEHSFRLGRPSSPIQTLNAVRSAVRHGLRPYVYFIHGLPEQTAETARRTVEAMIEIANEGAEKITLYRFKPLPLSAFERFPPAPPARKSRESKTIEKVARRLNMELKRRLIGKTLDVMAFKYISQGERKGTVTYPVSDGPVVLIREKNIEPGKRLKVQITETVSDRLVGGEML
jgi:radical SAM superfamily enzyme YgiQ (UPF0313 family)